MSSFHVNPSNHCRNVTSSDFRVRTVFGLIVLYTFGALGNVLAAS